MRFPRTRIAATITGRSPIQSQLRIYRARSNKSLISFRAASGDPVTSRPTTSREAVEGGLTSFQKKSYEEAVKQFNAALELNPTEDEAMAALYNLGCAYTKQKKWKLASEAIIRAINDYKLKLSVALKVGY